MPAYRGVLFDLFGTLIGFEPERLPEMTVAGRPTRTTVGVLGPLLARWVPGVSQERFLELLLSVSEEMARARAYDHVELPSRERFRRALERAGCEEEELGEAAVLLSRAHMRVIADATVVPPAHLELLAALRPHYRIGLVSNFDDTATGYDILVRHDLIRYLDTVVVSEAVGLRKPHPALFHVGLEGLGLPAEEVLFVGDTLSEDIAGAHAAGLAAAWIDGRRQGVPPGTPAPRYVVHALTELGDILARA